MLIRLIRTSIFPSCNNCPSGFLVAVTNVSRSLNPGNNIRCASNHQKWKRPFLKDLYHRRVMLGSDAETSRSSQDDWNYSSELYALSHRLKIPEVNLELIMQALTDQSFFESQDIEEVEQIQPSMPPGSIQRFPCNDELLDKGIPRFRHIVLAYLRAHWPLAPEEFIVAVASRIASNTALIEIARHLGLHHVVRTSDFPPSEHTLQSALLALIGTMDAAKVRDFVRRFILPRLYETPLGDVLPFRHPFPILKQYFLKWEKVKDLEVRIIGSGAVSTAMPFYEIAIYADKKRLIGQSGGEKPWVAMDLAAQDGLLRLWHVADEPRVFPFKCEELYAERFEKAQQPNHRLSDICVESTDMSLYTNEELARDPIDRSEVVKQYMTEVKREVGIPHRKRLRHFFSRGTVNRMSFRAMVKPQPHTI